LNLTWSTFAIERGRCPDVAIAKFPGGSEFGTEFWQMTHRSRGAEAD
jgi:hypothetical protein